MIKPSIEVEYNCPTCNIDFVVYHIAETRNEHCSYCGKKVKLTGVIRKIEGDKIITYRNDIVESTRDIPKRFVK